MSGKDQNIEELFKQTFEHFESDVSPGIWDSVQSQIGQTPAPANDGGATASGSSAASAGATAGIVKVAAVVGLAGSLVAGGFWLTQSDEAETAAVVSTENVIEVDPQSEQKSIAPEIIQENIDSETTANDKPESATEVDNAINNSITTYSKVSEDATTQEVVTSTPVKTSQSEGQSPQQEDPAVVSPSSNQVDNNSTNNLSEVTPEEKVDKNPEHRGPEASIHATIKKSDIPFHVQFSNDDLSAERMSWNFGDGSDVSNSSAPYHVFEQPGTYDVVLKVEGERNWISLDTFRIVVRKEITVMAPNVFTPNNDGINDDFRVEVNDEDRLTYFNCRVLDRNGRLVYESNNIYGHWNGYDMNDQVCAEGVYYYIIEVKTEGSKTNQTKGVVNLRR